MISRDIYLNTNTELLAINEEKHVAPATIAKIWDRVVRQQKFEEVGPQRKLQDLFIEVCKENEVEPSTLIDRLVDVLSRGAELSKVGGGCEFNERDDVYAAEFQAKVRCVLEDRIAVGMQSSDWFIHCLQSKTQLNDLIKCKRTDLHRAIIDKDVDKVDELLGSSSRLLEARDSNGCTPLMTALMQKEPEIRIIESLLRHWANPNRQKLTFKALDRNGGFAHNFGDNCLQLCLENGSTKPEQKEKFLNILELLLGHGANPSALVQEGTLGEMTLIDQNKLRISKAVDWRVGGFRDAYIEFRGSAGDLLQRYK